MILPALTTDAPLVSVIMFCRNRVHSIRRAVESVLRQSYPKWELIIQDGLSTDGTREALEGYTQDPRIKLVSEPDGGPFEAMWRAYKRGEGELFASCLSDEELLPEALQQGVNYLLFNPRAGAIVRDVEYTDIEGNILYRVCGDEFNFMDYMAMQFSLALCSMMFRRSALENIGYRTWPWRFNCADFELLVRVGEQHQIDYYPGVSAKYAQCHDGQISTSLDSSFGGAAGHLNFINDFFLEAPPEKPFRHLRPFPMIVTYKKLKEIYQKKGAVELEEKLEEVIGGFDLQYGATPLELAREAVGIGSWDLARDILADIRPQDGEHRAAIALHVQILRMLGLMQEAEKLEEELPIELRLREEGEQVSGDLILQAGTSPLRRLDQRVTFVSLAPGHHFQSELLEGWAKILQLLPSARLLLSNQALQAGDCRRHLRLFFKQRGVGPESLLLLPAQGQEILGSVALQSDIYLDTFPLPDFRGRRFALSQKIPFITMQPEEATGEQRETEWVTQNVKAYLVTAVKLASKIRRNLDLPEL